MTNVHLTFQLPWLLLLLIPALVIALVPYFRLPQKHRRSRNRVISLVFHITIVVLGIAVLTGAALEYDIPNVENQMIILVDVSHSNREQREQKTEYIEKLLEANESVYKIGIVAFAQEPFYAASLSYDTDAIMSSYNSYMLDGAPAFDSVEASSTNISEALLFARKQITNPFSSKIVLLSDGIETDGSALTAVMAIAAEGVKIDTVFFENDYGNEAQIIDIGNLSHSVMAGESTYIDVTIQSNVERQMYLTLYDNEKPGLINTFNVVSGIQKFSIEHTFESAGAHALYVTLGSVDADDTIKQNNHFYSYVYLDTYDKVLILDQNGESSALLERLDGRYSTPVTALDIQDAPRTLTGLSMYDQIILMNIANADMPEGLDSLLYSYVNELGGGILTVGGNKYGTNEPNAYGREDMNPDGIPSLYQRMLPVTCVDYYPPVAVMFLIDRSGSMEWNIATAESTRFEVAKKSVKLALDALSERDFVGIISFSDVTTLELSPTPMTQRAKIERSIDNIVSPVNGTRYSEAIEIANQSLRALQNVENRHIIIVSDGDPNDPPNAGEGNEKGYNYYIDQCTSYGIVISMIAIENSDITKDTVVQIAERGNGNAYSAASANQLLAALTEELSTDEIKLYRPDPFRPIIKDPSIVVSGISEVPMLGGYYGVKAKDGILVPLMGKYTPIYAQWSLGNNGGKVGSFMCDLNMVWSYDFMNTDDGMRIIENILRSLSPIAPVAIPDLNVTINRDNYSTDITVDTELQSGETIEVTYGMITIIENVFISELANPTVVTAKSTSGAPRCVIDFTDTGIYRITIDKKSGSSIISTYTTYVAFSYSSEYDAFVLNETAQLFLANIAASADGQLVPLGSPELVLRDVEKTASRVIDPTIPFVIIIIVLFLLDMAVRKFKFKWPWEIVRDYNIKKGLRQV